MMPLSGEDQVIAWLAEQDIASYLVGGCVRDRLLGRSVYDLDLAVDGDGLALARRLANHFEGDYYALDQERSTGRAILYPEGEPRLVVDVARFRGPDLAADLADRDFTINALAADVRAPAQVIDQHGGLADLQAGLLRPVSERCIRDDPLRALRAIRQAGQLGFVLSPEVEALIRRDGSALAEMSGERVRDELSRLLALPHAASYLEQLDDLGLLATILPELEPLRDLVQPSPHHLPVLAHSLETVRALEAILDGIQPEFDSEAVVAIGGLAALEPYALRLNAYLDQVMGDARPRLVMLKLAALLHDTGKPAARTVDEEGRIRFIGHHGEGVHLAGQALRRLRFNKPEVRLAEKIVRHHMRPLLLAQQECVSSRAVYRFFRDTDEASVGVLLHALADHRATYRPGSDEGPWQRLLDLVVRMLGDYWERQAERIDPPMLVDGNDLLREFRLQPGPLVGELLEAVREAQVSGEVRSREEALALIRTQLGRSA